MCRRLNFVWILMLQIPGGLASAMAADNAPVALYCEVSENEALVGDPVWIRASLRNDSPDEVVVRGGIPTLGGGGLWFQWRESEVDFWTTFNASHVIIEPGIRVGEARATFRPGQERSYYECLAFHRLSTPPNLPTAREHMLALHSPGTFEFRAGAKIGDYPILYSAPVSIKVAPQSKEGEAALDLGAKLIEKAVPLDSPGLTYGDAYHAQKLQRYLGDSRAAWLLKWKSAWATWMEADDLLRPRAARQLLISMRDEEEGVAREILTLSLARGYLKMGSLKSARAEAESLPEGSLERQVLLMMISTAEKGAARRKE